MATLVLGLFFVSAPGCTGSREDVESNHLRARIESLGKELDSYEKRIAEAGADPGLKSNLLSDQALLKSRIDRYREMLRQKSDQ